jgi:hypothetical protein
LSYTFRLDWYTDLYFGPPMGGIASGVVDDKKSRKLVEEVILQGLSHDIQLSIFSFGKEAESIAQRLDEWCDLGHGNYTHISSLEEVKDQIFQEAKGGP